MNKRTKTGNAVAARCFAEKRKYAHVFSDDCHSESFLSQIDSSYDWQFSSNMSSLFDGLCDSALFIEQGWKTKTHMVIIRANSLV